MLNIVPLQSHVGVNAGDIVARVEKKKKKKRGARGEKTDPD